MSSHFGTLFRVSSWGESHGPGIGVVVDGCPPLLPLGEGDLQEALDRRRPGQSKITTPRKEKDTVRILSGVFDGRTTGTPIAMAVFNEDHRSSDYSEMKEKFRPSHADFTYQEKFGIRDYAGGGRSSARETIARVAAGAIAGKILSLGAGVEIRAFIRSIHDVEAPADLPFPDREAVEETPVRCPHPETAERMVERIKAVRDKGDSVGGVVECRARGLPTGWGEPGLSHATRTSR